MRYLIAPIVLLAFLMLCRSMRNTRNLLLAALCIGVVGLSGCASATKTAYQGETVAYVSLKAAVDAYNAFKKTHTVSASDDAKAKTLLAAAKNDEILAVQITEGATNSAAINSTTLADFVTFLKQLGVNL
jgi:hypothetical protein